MDIDFSHHEPLHYLGNSATRSIELCWYTLAVLLVVAGGSLLPPHALPAHANTVHLGTFN